MRKPPASPSRRAFLKLLAAGAATASTTAAATQRAPQTSRIGVLVPYSTLYPRLGESFLAGLRLALSTATADAARGALLLTASAGRTPSEAVSAADELLSSQHADLLVGMVGSHAVAGVKPLLARHRRPFLAATTGVNAERPEERDPLVATISLAGWQNALEAGAWAVGRFGPKAVVVTSRYDSGYDHAFALTAGIDAGGGLLQGMILTDDGHGGHDFYRAIEKVRELRPDVAVLLHSHPGALETLDLLDRTLFMDAPFVTSGPVPSASNERVAAVTPWSPRSSTAANREFVARYAALHGRPPDGFSLLGYETGVLLDRTLSDDGTFQPHRFLETARRQRFETPRGDLAIQPGGATLGARRHVYDPASGWGHVDLAGDRLRATTNAALDILHAAPRTGWLHDYLCV